MNRAKIKLLVAGLVVGVGISVLTYAGLREGRLYYMEVDKFVADPQVHNQRVKLRGTVAAENLAIKSGEMKASFELTFNQARLPVVYRGVIPDLFKAGADVVVEGKLGSDQVFQADGLTTKCASKYEPAAPAPASRPEGRS